MKVCERDRSGSDDGNASSALGGVGEVDALLMSTSFEAHAHTTLVESHLD
jgi:hypothetical protein